jgi:hypothetical protein
MTTTIGIMRVTNHPRKDQWLILKFPPQINPLIGSFGPAQQALDLGGYVMHHDQLDALTNWARYNAVQLLVEIRATGEPTRPVQCGNTTDTWTGTDGREYHDTCAAPYPAGKIPRYCGACGQAANPIIVAHTEPDTGTRCRDCGHLNHGGPAYCVSCANPLPERHLTAPALPRTHGQPRPLADTINELKTTLTP